ncbi:unnamed protein product [Toxocara canis]|uniref:Nkap_C domain-containing protein n=1 Tax=Toxocara canis TaxID=6265 RepID=A0A183TVL5_TOXCA|nr:unnamed protein product [Toxocara canis]
MLFAFITWEVPAIVDHVASVLLMSNEGAVCVRIYLGKGEPSPFESWMLSRAGMFDKHDWRKPATNYNLLYSREKFLMALGEEMRNRGIVRHDATLTMRQQRMMEKVLKSWNEEDGEQQLEQLKKSIDISALRGQVCHGAGAAEVLRGGRAHDSVDRSVGEWGGEAGGTSGAGAETCTTGLNRTVFKRVSLQEAVPDECEAAFEGGSV